MVKSKAFGETCGLELLWTNGFLVVTLSQKVVEQGYPRPMDGEEISKAIRRSIEVDVTGSLVSCWWYLGKALDKRDQRVKDTESARNDFEAYIYSSRWGCRG